MKIAYVSTMNESSWGGSEELWSQAAAVGLSLGHDVLALVPRFDPMDHRLVALVGKGLRMATWQPQDLHPLGSLLAGGPAWGAWNPLRDFEPDIVVVSHGGFMDPTQHPDLLSLLTTWKVPYIVVVQCNTELQLPTDAQRESHRAYFSKARKVLFVSRRNLETARIQLADAIGNAEVIDNPVNLRDRSAVAWPDESGPVRMACVARLDAHVKGFDVLFQALSGEAWKGRDWTLDIYGRGVNAVYLGELVSWLGLAGKVRFAGQVEDVRGIWERSHILVMASRMEGAPLALFEAMWCARTCVVTDVGGNADLVEDGRTGFLAEAATAACMERALERAWADRHRWKSMGEAARESVSRRDPSPPATLASLVAREWEDAARTNGVDGNRPTVSVIIPCYNYASYLPQAVESVLAQTFRDLEILVVDDGSTDDSLAVARSLERRYADSGLRVIAQANSGQPAISRNNAILESRGRYILPLDADDMLAPTCVARMVEVLESDPSVSIVHGDVLCFEDRKVWYQNSAEWDSVEIAAGNRQAYSSMYRREVWDKVGGYRTNVRGYEDWDFWIGCAEAGFRGRRIPTPLLYYRTKADGVFHQAVANDKTLRANIVLNHPSMYAASQRAEARSFLEGRSSAGPDLEARRKVPEIVARAERALSGGDAKGALDLLRAAEDLSGGDAAISELRRRLESSGALGSTLEADLAEVDRLWSAGERDRALEAMQGLDDKHGARKEIVRTLAWMLRELGRSGQAHVQYARLVMLDPEDLSSHEFAAAHLIADGRAARAETHLRKLLVGKPGQPDVMIALARICASSERIAEACELFRWIAEEHPDHEFAEEARRADAELRVAGGATPGSLSILEERILHCARREQHDRFYELAGEAIVAAEGSLAPLPRLATLLERLRRPAGIGPSALATRLLGELSGLEIGGSAHNPFGLRTRNVGMFQAGYVSDQLRHCGTWMPVDIEADAAGLPVADESEDFVLSSHVLEHTSDVVSTLLEWFRVVRDGGFLHIVVPLPRASGADYDKSPAPWSHLFDDFLRGARAEDEPEQGEPGGGHYHLLTLEELERSAAEIFGDRCEVVARQAVDDKVGNGCVLVLRKLKPLSDCFPWTIRAGSDEAEIVLVESDGAPSRLGLPAGLPAREPVDGLVPEPSVRAARLGSWNAGWPASPVPGEPLVVGLVRDPRTESVLPDWFRSGCTAGFSGLGAHGARFVTPTEGVADFHGAASAARAAAAAAGSGWFAVMVTPCLPTVRLLEMVRERMTGEFDAIVIGADPVVAVDSRGCPTSSGLHAGRVDMILCRISWWDANARAFVGLRTGPEVACAFFRRGRVHPLYRGAHLLGAPGVEAEECGDPLWQAWLVSTRRYRVPAKEDGHVGIAELAERHPGTSVVESAPDREKEKALHAQASRENELLGRLAEDPGDLGTLREVVDALRSGGRTMESEIQARRLVASSTKKDRKHA